MANFTFSSGTATIGVTEFSVAQNANYSSGSPKTTLGYVQTVLDFSAMTAAETYRIKIYEKVNGGTQRLLTDPVTLVGVQGQLYALPLVILGDGWDVTVQKIAGTDRSIRFSVRQDTNDVNTATITAGAIAAATFAANAIDANALAASAATEIQTGLATSAALALVQVDTDDIQARLPAALDGSGNIKAGVQTMAAGAITAIAAGVLAVVVEGAITVQGALRLIMSSTVFNVSGFLANAPNYRDAADTKNRIVATTTTDGRTTVTVDPA